MSVNRTLCSVSKYSRQLCNSKMISTCSAAVASYYGGQDHYHHQSHGQQPQPTPNRYQHHYQSVFGANQWSSSGYTLIAPTTSLLLAGRGLQQVRQHSTIGAASNTNNIALNKKRRGSDDLSKKSIIQANSGQLCLSSGSGLDVISNNYTTALSNMTKDQANDLVFRLTDQERQLLLQVLSQFQSNQERKKLEGKPVLFYLT